MSSFNADTLIKTQIDKALAAELQQAAAAPVPVAETVSVPAQAPTAAPAVPPQAPAAPSSPELAQLLTLVQEQQKELQKLQRQLKPKEPEAPRPTIKSVEQRLEELQEQVVRSEQLRRVERELPAIPEYATVKSVPDLAELVYTTIQQEQRAARERGEGEVQVSVAQAVRKVKADITATLRQHLANQEILKELGLAPALSAATPANTGRALSSDLPSSGSGAAQTQLKPNDWDGLIKRQIQASLKYLPK
jgi:hypothetical protein